MPIFERIFRNLHRHDGRKCDKSEGLAKEWDADIGYEKLEPRKVLSATFLFDEGLLSLTDFDSGQDLTFSQVGPDGDGFFLFEIDNGDFAESGLPNPGIETGPGTLSIAASLISNGISIDGNSAIGITQTTGTEGFSAPSLQLSNFQLLDQSLELSSAGAITLGDISVRDTNPTDLNDVEISVQASSLTISGVVTNESVNPNAASIYVSDEDLTLDGGTLQSEGGDITVFAEGQISFLVDANGDRSTGISSENGDVEISAGRILMNDSSLIEALDGSVTLSASGGSEADIILGRIEANDDINISATGDVADGTNSEQALLVSNRLDIVAASIGDGDEIEIEAMRLSFNTSGTSQLHNLEESIFVDSFSSANGGALVANGRLTIGADIELTGSFSFLINDSSNPDGSVELINDSVVLLDSSIDQSIEFIATGNISFDTGSIATSGAGAHSVFLTAGTGTSPDSSLGAVTNTQGAVLSVTTDRLVINSEAGIGQIGNGFRTDVGRLQAANLFDNPVVVAETNGISIDGITNTGRDIALSAGGHVQFDGVINSSSLRVVANGDVVQTALSVIESEIIGIVQQSTAVEVANDLDSNNRYDIVIDQNNRFSTVAASNDFDGGAIAIANGEDVTVGQIDSFAIAAGVQFDEVSGVTSNFTGLAVRGPADDASGDILLSSGGTIEIANSLVAGNGRSDIRLVASGSLTQTPAGVISANEFGFRQELSGDVLLNQGNQFDVLAGLNASGTTLLADVDEFTVGNISEQTLGVLAFATTNGLAGNDIFLQSMSSLVLDSAIDAGTHNVYLLANGDIFQSSAANIQASLLAIRQEATLFDSEGDFDSNGRFDVLLPGQNEVDEIVALNSFDSGSIAYKGLGNLLAGQSDSISVIGFVFDATTGVETSSGNTGFGGGDILLETDGAIQIAQAVTAGSGNANVFLTAAGDILQTDAGTITASGLGVSQIESSFAGSEDIDADGALSIELLANNQIDRFAASNVFANGEISFNNSVGFVVDTITATSIGGLPFEAIDGLSADDGNVSLSSAGFLDLRASIVSSQGTVRLLANGDISQSSEQGVTAAALGIIQAGETIASQNDLDSDGSFEIVLDGLNDVDLLGASNGFSGAIVAFNNLGNLEIGVVESSVLGGSMFPNTVGLASGGDIVLQTTGAISILSPVDASSGSADVRIQSSGDILQTPQGVINADNLSARQVGETVVSAGDLDLNGTFDISLQATNSINTFATVNSFGDVVVVNGSELSIGTIEIQVADQLTFQFTEGANVSGNLIVEVQNGNLTVASPVASVSTAFDSVGAVQVNATVDSTEVLIAAEGDVVQSSSGVITSQQLGIRQQATLITDSNDVDSSGQLDVILDADNDVDVFAVLNVFDGGYVVVQDIDDLTIGSFSETALVNGVFTETTGVTTQGDVLIQAGGFLNVANSVSVSAAADVRLIFEGDLVQQPNAIIIANQLAIRQQGDGEIGLTTDFDNSGTLDVHLCSDNLVNVLAVSNPVGAVYFQNSTSLVVDSVSARSLGGISFQDTVGIDAGGDVGIQVENGGLDTNSAVSGSNVLFQSEGSIELNAQTSGQVVRLVGRGDITQSDIGIIDSTQLGVVQESSTFDSVLGFDDNGIFDVILDAANTTSIFSSQNNFPEGVVVFSNSGDTTIGEVNAFAFGDKSFPQISGVAGQGDILLQSAGGLEIDNSISAASGTSDVRLIGTGEISQSPEATITASSLGVRQLDNAGDVQLESANEVQVFGAFNPGGEVNFVNAQSFAIGTVGSQQIGNINFEPTAGIEATDSNVRTTEGDLIVDETISIQDGDQILLQSDGFIQLTSAVSAPEVRLIANGDILQLPSGVITADVLGVRQEGSLLNANGDSPDPNGQFDVILDGANTVGLVGATNVFEQGVVVINSTSSVDVGSVSEASFGEFFFEQTNGISTSGDVILQSPGSLRLLEPIETTNGASDVRLIAAGDILQATGAVIVADNLGVRQEALSFNELSDIDLNERFDVVLAADNVVSTFAASNPVGNVILVNDVALNIETVAFQNVGLISFEETLGVGSGNDIIVDVEVGNLQVLQNTIGSNNAFLDSAGSILIDSIVAANNVRLIGSGDILQSETSSIETNLLGVRQQATTLGPGADADPNDRFDIVLDDGNSVVTFAAFNAFEGGVVAFNNVSGTTIGVATAVAAETFDFGETQGVVTTAPLASGSGDIILQSGGFLDVRQTIVAGGGSSDLRVIANGDVIQFPDATVVANELGVRLIADPFVAENDLNGNSQFDLIWTENNLANRFAAANPSGDVSFTNGQQLVLGTVGPQNVGLIDFEVISGVSGMNVDVSTTFGPLLVDNVVDATGNLALQSASSISLNASLDATSVRLIGNGDIVQNSTGSIRADLLGVRLQQAPTSGLNDLDSNGRLDVLLDSTNDVDTVAILNQNNEGVIALNNLDDLTIGNVPASTIGNVNFPETIGLTSVLLQSGQSGNLDSEVGDILVQAGGAITVESPVVAGDNPDIQLQEGHADLRLIANGNVSQSVIGTISANELGVRIGETSTPSNLILDSENEVLVFAAENNSADGVVAFLDADTAASGLLIGSVAQQTLGTISFDSAVGVTTTSTGSTMAGVDNTDSGDILIATGGFLQLSEEVNASDGNADVRLVANGEISQASEATISANLLGVRQLGSIGNVQFESANQVEVFGAFNPNGEVTFVNAQSLVIGTVVGQQIGNVIFAETAGIEASESSIRTTEGDLVVGETIMIENGDQLLIQSDGFIELTSAIGAPEVRLVARGDILQEASGTITAEVLGIRQVNDSDLFNGADRDGNNQLDVILDAANQVDLVAATNVFEGGLVAINSINSLDIGSVSEFAFEGFFFEQTIGISAVGDVVLQSAGSLRLLESIQTTINAFDVRLISAGDILQEEDAVIVADRLGVRQEAATFNEFVDTDPNGQFDAILNANNTVNNFAVSNPIGDISFTNGQQLELGTVEQRSAGLIDFQATSGITGMNVDVNTTAGGLLVGNTAEATDDLILQSASSISLSETLEATSVRLVGNGDIIQTSAGTIRADLLGVRLQQVPTSALNDLDSNDRLDVLLDSLNDVDTVAILNQNNEGVIALNDSDDLTIGIVPASATSNVSFAETIGLSSVLLQNGQSGILDSDAGDILVQAGGAIALESPVVAGGNPDIQLQEGNADLRLVANGNVSQSVTGTISANELGVRIGETNTPSNAILDSENEVLIFAAENNSADGVVAFLEADAASSGLFIGSVGQQTLGTISFETTTGVTTTSTGPAVAGVNDTDSGDILIVAGGFLQLGEEVNASDGISDVRLTASGDINQEQDGAVIANELGVRQIAAIADSQSDRNSNQRLDVNLGIGINDADIIAILNQQGESDLTYGDQNAVTIGSVSGQSFGAASFDTTLGLNSDDGQTAMTADGTGTISIAAATNLSDAGSIPITTGGNAVFRGDDRIELVNQGTDQINIGGNALFQSSSIAVGQDGEPANGATGNVFFGSITIDGLQDENSTADITEDDDAVLSGQTSIGLQENQISSLVLTAGGDVSNEPNTTLRFDRAQFNAESGNVFLGNQDSDELTGFLNSEIELGANANNVSIAADSSVQINGLSPVVDNRASDVDLSDNFGTRVTQTLFLRSAGHVEQTLGSLDVAQSGIIANQHIHLNSIEVSNQVFAATAGNATAATNLADHQNVLDQLQTIDGSEVDATLVQSVSVAHSGSLNIGSVLNPDAQAEGIINGVSTNATDTGSVLLISDQQLTLNQSVSAEASASLPQVTVHAGVSTAGSDVSSQIMFAPDAAITVDGANELVTNFGVVNAPQTVAFFGTDEDDNGAIDNFFFDRNLNGTFDAGDIDFETTTISSLDGTSTAPQLIQAIYGNQGEVGYRLAFVFDSERRFDESFTEAQEIPNLYTANGTSPTERFDVVFSSVLEDATTRIVGSEPTIQTNLVEQAVDGSSGDVSPFNFNSIFEKVDPFTSEALSLRTDSPLLFTVVEVRNDQDINLFVGPEASNALNAVSETLEAQIETAGLQPTVPDFTFAENIVPEIVVPPQVNQQISVVANIELPELTQLETPGNLVWQAVKIDDPTTEEDDNKPELNMTEIDGELVLNDPLIDYDPLDENWEKNPKELSGLSRNQFEKIKAVIETDPGAEVGLWYKVYIDNNDNPTEDNELLFYYYKTGKSQDAEESKTDSESNESTDPAGFQESPDVTSDSTGSSELEAPAADLPENLAGADLAGVLPASIILTTLMDAGKQKQVARETNASPNFQRLNRLKEQWKELLKQT